MKGEDVLEELRRREPLFHREEFGRTRADFENMMAPEFWEVGASGRVYTAGFVLGALEKRYSEPHDDAWDVSDFKCERIAPDNYLVTYTLTQRDRVTRRATIWRWVDDRWKAVYHQGTVVA